MAWGGLVCKVDLMYCFDFIKDSPRRKHREERWKSGNIARKLMLLQCAVAAWVLLRCHCCRCCCRRCYCHTLHCQVIWPLRSDSRIFSVDPQPCQKALMSEYCDDTQNVATVCHPLHVSWFQSTSALSRLLRGKL